MVTAVMTTVVATVMTAVMTAVSPDAFILTCDLSERLALGFVKHEEIFSRNRNE